jgi:hypothetical protein
MSDYPMAFYIRTLFLSTHYIVHKNENDLFLLFLMDKVLKYQ